MEFFILTFLLFIASGLGLMIIEKLVADWWNKEIEETWRQLRPYEQKNEGED